MLLIQLIQIWTVFRIRIWILWKNGIPIQIRSVSAEAVTILIGLIRKKLKTKMAWDIFIFFNKALFATLFIIKCRRSLKWNPAHYQRCPNTIGRGRGAWPIASRELRSRPEFSSTVHRITEKFNWELLHQKSDAIRRNQKSDSISPEGILRSTIGIWLP